MKKPLIHKCIYCGTFIKTGVFTFDEYLKYRWNQLCPSCVLVGGIYLTYYGDEIEKNIISKS